MTKFYLGIAWNFFLLAGIIGLIINCGLILHFIFFRADFFIVSNRLICEQPLNNRCFTQIQAQLQNKQLINYVPLSDEFSDGELGVGNTIKKEHYFSYEINGKTVSWFPKSELRWIVISLLFILCWSRWYSKEKTNQISTAILKGDIFRHLPFIILLGSFLIILLK